MNKANRIKELATNFGITSKELAKQTGIPYDSLKNYEYGRRIPTGRALVALENFFGVSGAYILGETDTKEHTYAWEDKEKLSVISENFYPLMNKILIAANACTDFEQKMLFDILVELRHIVSIKDENNCKRAETLSFIQDTINRSNQLIKVVENSNLNIKK